MNKNNVLQTPPGSRYILPATLAGYYLLVTEATRLTLSAQALAAHRMQWLDLPRVMVLGLGYDLVTCIYLAAPLVLYLLLLPQGLYASRGHRTLVWGGVVIASCSLTCLAAVEYHFFGTFNARLNFVAIEYLVHPHELFIDIRQLYPVGTTLLASAAVAVIAVWHMRHQIRASLAAETPFRGRLGPALLVLLALLPLHLGIDATSSHTGKNRVADELSGNGIYSFFSAALNSQPDFEHHPLPIEEAVARIRTIVAQYNTRFINGGTKPIARHTIHDSPDSVSSHPLPGHNFDIAPRRDRGGDQPGFRKTARSPGYGLAMHGQHTPSVNAADKSNVAPAFQLVHALYADPMH